MIIPRSFQLILVGIDIENTGKLTHSDFRVRPNTGSTRCVHGVFLFYPYLSTARTIFISDLFQNLFHCISQQQMWLKLSSWHARTHLSCKVTSVTVDALVKSVVRATPAIVSILTLEPIQFNSWIGNFIDFCWRDSHIFVEIYILHWGGGVILAGFPSLAALRGVMLAPLVRPVMGISSGWHFCFSVFRSLWKCLIIVTTAWWDCRYTSVLRLAPCH